MSGDDLKDIKGTTIKRLQETIKRLEELIADPKTTEREKKRSQKLIEKIQKDIAKIEAGPNPTKYCKFCGELYDPEWTMLHGDNHLFLSTVKYNEKTGELLKKPYLDDRAFDLFGKRKKRGSFGL